MPIITSTAEEIRVAKLQVLETTQLIARLTQRGKKVHIIWDFDHVLGNGRSDDIFGLLGFTVELYFKYEERLITETPERGLWSGLAKRCGRPGFQDSQDLVTARSSFLLMRAMKFLVAEDIPIRWTLGLGHQPKAGSYRIAIDPFKGSEDVEIICVDDAKKHVDIFLAVAAELGMADRCHGIVAHQVRRYDEAELRREIEGVMEPGRSEPYSLVVRPRSADDPGRYLSVSPNPRATMLDMFERARQRIVDTATINENRASLEEWADKIWPGRHHSDSDLLFLRDILTPS